MAIYSNLIDAIGNTPLVQVQLDVPAKVYAKLEYLNPSGSIKDRSSLYMIEAAEKNGLIKPGGTIIEASSGNQGISTAMIANSKGYKVIITVSEKISSEKKMALEAYGVKMIVCKGTSDFNDPEHYYNVAKKLSSEIENSYMLGQYFSLNNGMAHYYSTGKEIYEQIGDKLTHVFCAMGSVGTINGISRYLKEKNTNIKVIGVDAKNSFIATHGNPKPYNLDGMGIDYDAPLLKSSIIDEIILADDNESHFMLKKLARKHGFLVGPASGAVAACVEKYSKKLNENEVAVMLFTDSGRAYLSKPFYL
jgi:cystathionine beta-synthase